MKKYVFERYHAYTSHPSLTVRQYEEMQAGNYNDFPDYVIYRGKRYGVEPLNWGKEPIKTTSAGFNYFEEGLAMKIETLSKSPDYDKPNGCGDCHDRLTIKTDCEVGFVKDGKILSPA